MENYFTVGETAKIVKTTSETLRHYDRIGLVKPSRKEEWTGYRYYSKQDIVRLNTIRALRSMELSLGEIREVLEYDDLQKIVGFLERAERKADEKIAELQYCKAKIQLARSILQKGNGTILRMWRGCTQGREVRVFLRCASAMGKPKVS